MNNPITCYYSNIDYGDKKMLIPMKVDYGVRILVYLASFPQESIVKATDISKQRHIPEKFLFQISFIFPTLLHQLLAFLYLLNL